MMKLRPKLYKTHPIKSNKSLAEGFKEISDFCDHLQEKWNLEIKTNKVYDGLYNVESNEAFLESIQRSNK